ncbi:hypothetical protein BU17DRAFT_85730 [Hysterangium stoloniferum]|nr:hypothetical protein BU17DRAFT_85730 [Hysterangium stoloniferum]
MFDGQSHKPPPTKASPKDATPGAPPRFKRPKTSKACNACRKQKSRCERLAGDAEGCHRCGIIGIPCTFDPEASSSETVKTRKPRPILPRNQSEPGRIRADHLQILANTTTLLSREPLTPPTASSYSIPFHLASLTPLFTTTNAPLSPETVSKVESTISLQPDIACFRAEWQRWIAPLKLLRTLVRQCAGEDSNSGQPYCPQDGVLLSATEQTKLKNYFLLKYSPWLPAVRLGQNGSLDEISPFLSAVIYATASRTFGEIARSTMDRLRGQALHHVGQAFADPSAYPLVESLYALLILIIWPLDPADDVALLVDGAKRIASNGSFGGMLSTTNEEPSQNVDHIRLWYTICVNETIVTLGAGSIATSPDMNNFIRTFGTGSQIALRGGGTSDILLALELKLHNVATAAMAERPFSLDKNIPEIPNSKEAIYNFIRTINIFLTSLEEWEIEFCTIAGECDPREAVHYAVLEFEYHYFRLTLTLHAVLTLSHACPILSAPDDVKFTAWSWCMIKNKSSHAIIRLFNTHTSADPHTEGRSLLTFTAAPDRIFAMVVLAIMAVLRHQVATAEFARRRGHAEAPSAGFTKQAADAIRKAEERMREIGYPKRMSTMYYHPAGRYADILEAVLRIWDEKFAENVASLVPRAGDQSFVDDYRIRTQASSSGAGGVRGGSSEMSPVSLDNSRLHFLANTTMPAAPREPPSASSRSLPFHSASRSPHISAPATPNTPLSPEILSTVESVLFPIQLDHMSENESVQFRADWQRWIAPLTLLQTLVRKSTKEDPNWKQSNHPQDGASLSATEEVQLKNHFLLKYSPWLPAIHLGRNGSLDEISPLLSAVIYATASRTFGKIARSTMDSLRGHALHHVGQVFSNPTAYPLLESLYALLILIVWPLDAADNIALLVDAAKRIASDENFGGMHSTTDEEPSQSIDHMRLWYTICVNETIVTLGAGSIATSPDMSNFFRTFGTGSQIALRGGDTSDVLLALELNLHSIATAAMAKRPFSLDKNIPEIPKPKEAVYDYIRTITVFLTQLDEWEIEFCTIADECDSQEAAHYAVLEFEYHYFCLMLITHATLTLSLACPIFSAPKDIKYTTWSWSMIGNRSSHAIIRLFNTHTSPDPHTEDYSLPSLAVVPDRIFAMVVLAVMLVFRLEVAMAEYAHRRGYGDVPPSGYTRQGENAIRRAVQRMRYVGSANGVSTMYYHPAARYADILESLLRMWDEKFAHKASSVVPKEVDPHVDDFRMGTRADGSGTGGGVQSGGVGISGHPNVPLMDMHQDGTGMVEVEVDSSFFEDFFSGAAAAFTWEGSGTYNWTTG